MSEKVNEEMEGGIDAIDVNVSFRCPYCQSKQWATGVKSVIEKAQCPSCGGPFVLRTGLAWGGMASFADDHKTVYRCCDCCKPVEVVAVRCDTCTLERNGWQGVELRAQSARLENLRLWQHLSDFHLAMCGKLSDHKKADCLSCQVYFRILESLGDGKGG